MERRLWEEEESQGMTYWHSLFHTSLKVALSNYRQLEIWPEVPLSVSSLRMDFLVIQNAGGSVLNHPIAQQFRKLNLIEYKAPKASLLVNDYNKGMVYTRLQQIYKNPRDFCLQEASMTFICTRWPALLFKQLKEMGRTVIVNQPIVGIYQVAGDICPSQIVVLNRLKNPEILYPFAPLITGKTREEERPFIRLMQEYIKRGDDPVLQELVQCSIRYGLVMDYEKEEVLKMYLRDIPGGMEQWIRELMETEQGKKVRNEVWEQGKQNGYQKGIKKGVARGVEKGIEKGVHNGKIEVVKKALLSGIDPKLVAQISGFSEEMVIQISQDIYKN